jgi:sec-independent protein translocase protein TatA
MHLGLGELVTLALVFLIVFSASRMSALGNAVGKFVYSFRRAARGEDLIDVTPRRVESSPATPRVVEGPRRS